MTRCIFGLKILAILTAASAFVFPMAAGADEIDKEFEFASGLIEMGFADFADKVVQQVIRLHPDQQDRAKLTQGEILIYRRKFPEAEAIIAELGHGNPKAQAISLKLANKYYQIGETEKAKNLYNGFFQQYEGRMPTDPDLMRFYLQSAYEFAQMLESAGDMDGTLKAYARVINATKDKGIQHKMMADQAELYVKTAEKTPDQRDKYLAEAKKLCDTIQWGAGMTVSFGQSIITLAHIELVKGDKGAARKVLQTNMDIFKEIDKAMQEQGGSMADSPMAGARFLLGDLFEQEGMSAESQGNKEAALDNLSKAFIEFYNVFAKYGSSDWGPQAGVRAQTLKTKLEKDYGKTIKVEIGQLSPEAIAQQFRMADNLYAQRKYSEAEGEYLKALKQFPETPVSVMALANLTLCYANMGDDLSTKMVAAYLGERFRASDIAPKALLAAGKYYFDRTNAPMYQFVYDAYLNNFPKDPAAANVLYMLAVVRKNSGDPNGAAGFFQRIVDNYKQDKNYPKALSQQAWGAFAASNFAQAVKGFTVYVAESQPSPDKVLAQLSLGECHRQLGQFAEALRAYQTVIQWVTPPNNPYATSTADVLKNKDYLERAWFYLALCFSRLKDPPAAVPEYRAKALKAYDFYLTTYPNARQAPKALSLKGAVQMELKDPNAAKTYEELATRYPESDEGKNALFSLVNSAIEINQIGQAQKAFQGMIQQPDKYSLEEFTRVGQAMLDAKLYVEAAQAFAQVSGKSEDRILLERSFFGLGSAQFALQKYDEAAKALGELMTRYPKSGLFFDAKFMLGTAYEKTGKLDDAIATMSDISKYAGTNALIMAKAGLALGQIHKARGDKNAALAAFQLMALTGNPNDAAIRPLIDECLMESIALYMELNRYADAEESCDQFLNQFPNSPKVETVRKLKADAKMKAAQAPKPAPAPVSTAAPAK